MPSEQPREAETEPRSLDRPGGGAGGPQALPSSWPRLDQEPDLGDGDEGMGGAGREGLLHSPRALLDFFFVVLF